MKPDITKIIERAVRHCCYWWKLPSAYEINNGSCEEFVALICKFVPGAEDNATPDFTLPGHYWIEYEGKCYDAECPQGVDHWEQLPIFVKYRQS
jgi:hypothetical protein